MLNELFELSRSLDRVNINVVSWHRFLKECPRGGKSFFIDIDAESEIVGLRQITDPDRLSQLRKYEKAAGYSFPSFNILPLWRFDEDLDLEAAKSVRKALSSKKTPTPTEATLSVLDLLARAHIAWVDPNKKKGGRDAMDKINGCLENTVVELKAIVAGSEEPGAFPIIAMLERASKISGSRLHEQLSRWLVDQFTTPSDNWPTYIDLLFSGATPKPFSIVFELSDQAHFEYPVNHLKTYECINSRLQGDDAIAFESVTSLGPDAFAASDGGRDESFPEVKMSRFGKINLRAMSRESLCQIRYGVAESKSFSVSQSTRQACKNALEWISRDERQNKTWCDLTSVNANATVLFAYPLTLPAQPPELAFLINGNDDPTEMQVEGEFEACAEAIAKAFSGHRVAEEKRDVIVFVLTKPDGFRTKVLCSNRCTEDHIVASAQDWQIGCRNIPDIKSRQFGPDKGSKPVWRDPLTPFTTEVVACLNTVWMRQGTESSACKAIRVADALSLLLDRDAALQQTVRHLLDVILKNTTGLLLATGNSATRWQVHVVARNLQKHQLILPRILGLLLWKLNLRKGDYMKTPSFLVGRMLSLADQLHLQYCQQVRKGEIPPQLIGNALMPTALNTPVQALSILGDRIRPYWAWAQTVNKGEKVGLAKYLLAQLSGVSTQLAECELPKRTSDADRAVMLLGYLSRPEKESPNLTTSGKLQDDNSDQE